jgi:hypothetical protein
VTWLFIDGLHSSLFGAVPGFSVPASSFFRRLYQVVRQLKARSSYESN